MDYSDYPIVSGKPNICISLFHESSPAVQPFIRKLSITFYFICTADHDAIFSLILQNILHVFIKKTTGLENPLFISQGSPVQVPLP